MSADGIPVEDVQPVSSDTSASAGMHVAERDRLLAEARRHTSANVDMADCLWSVGNASEAYPGVLPPLVADFWQSMCGYCMRVVMHELGLINRREVSRPLAPKDIQAGVVLGRMAGNVNAARRFGHLIPGMSGDEFERGMFGSTREGVDDGPPLPPWRLPLVVWRFVALLVRYPREMRAMQARTHARWKKAMAELTTLDLKEAIAEFDRECNDGQVDVMRFQLKAGILSPLAMAPLERVATEVASKDECMQIMSGLGGVHEAAVLDQLWEVSHGRRALDGFLSEHGFMGQDTGNLINPNWREDHRALQPVIRAYAQIDVSERPLARAQANAKKSSQVREKVAARIGWFMRVRLGLATWLCQHYLPLREVGKSALLAHQAMGRAYAMRIGALLVERDVIDSPEDVFFLWRRELDDLEREPRNMRRQVAERQSIHDVYRQIELPNLFTPEDIDALCEAYRVGAEQSSDDAPASTGALRTLTGVGVSNGRCEGIARVVTDPASLSDFEPGQILVCRNTDPSWAPLFSIAGALVADIGGMLSHAAIIARELGVPAIVNTGNGTRVIRDGQRISVDAGEGLIEILDAAGGATEVGPPATDEPVVALRSTPAADLGQIAAAALDASGYLLGIVPLREARDPDVFGGKAASLSESLLARLPVPEGFALSWKCIEALETNDTATETRLRAICAAVQGTVAVRSSGIGEDAGDASFAGQHETVLGLTGEADILAAIRRVAASRNAAHVKSYREQMTQETVQPRLGIVVQLLVDADRAGVMFTRNPVDGSHERVIEAAWGLGEVVVGSLVSPDHYRVSAVDGTVTQASAGRKDRVIQRDDDGRYQEYALDDKAASELCLGPHQLSALNELAQQCEHVYGVPQDIEWAFAGERLYLLQSRPITVK